MVFFSSPTALNTGNSIICGSSTFIFSTNNSICTGAGGGGSTTTTTDIWPTITAGNFTTTFTEAMLLIEEEDYLNNQEYWDLARARGVQFQIRTAEQRRREEEAAAADRAANEARERERQAAHDRAQELLLEHLTLEQRQTLHDHKWFVVTGGRSGKSYRIRTDRGYQHNIDELRGDRPVVNLCCHLKGTLPHPDHFLGQALCLQYDEDAFLKLANRRAA